MRQSSIIVNRGTARSSRGFTLVEIMVVLFVLAVIVMIFAGSVVMAEKAAHVNGQFAQALSLCQHKLDQLRAVGYGRLNYTELDDAEIVDPTPTSSPFSFVVVDEAANYLLSPTATLTIQDLTAGKTKIVTATITWKKARHQTKTCTVSLSGIIANIQ